MCVGEPSGLLYTHIFYSPHIFIIHYHFMKSTQKRTRLARNESGEVGELKEFKLNILQTDYFVNFSS